ncbi:MAG: hypothetical protein EA396_11300 [Anaerolineaceae bacterium]|nr:MAG: hypothetical protein EA396_11300 [Anaerolineaceae bacterium]
MVILSAFRRILIVIMMCCGIIASVSEGQDTVYDVPGTIAYIGTDYNIATFDLRAGQVSVLTDDASRTRRYQWPTWANDGRLAYFCCDPSGGQPFTQIFISDDGLSSGDLRHVAPNTVFNHASWSPRHCDASDDCRDLAVLLSIIDRNTLSVDIIRDGDDDAGPVRVGLGAPFYYSWSPDGGRLLTQRDVRRLDVFDLASGSSEQLPYAPGFFPAPHWSPVDDRLLVGVLNDGATDLAIIANEQVRVLRSTLRGELSFNWSPSGDYVAYRTVDNDSASDLIVIDAVTGELVTQTDDSAFAFFWSPDSRLLAYVTIATPPGTFNIAHTPASSDLIQRVQEDGLRWSVLDVATGQTRNYGSFIPTADMIYLLLYFNQFAQSHSIWSPDSSHIVFGEVLAEGRRTVSILDTTRRDAVPFAIADGLVGVWSYR